MSAPVEHVTVHKLDASGSEVWAYRGVTLARTASSLTLEARFGREDARTGEFVFRLGDRMVETFYVDRWYNVFAVYDGESERLKGWYCNIARPARIEGDDIYQEDLALDLVVYPGGAVEVLDEDEFEALRLPAEEQERALRTLGELSRRAARKEPPFRH